jgi:hypothetical protein
MRQRYGSATALLTLLATAVPATPTTGADAQATIFQFENRAWVNLHHFLYVLGRAAGGAPDTKRAAVVDAPKDGTTAALTEDERRIWTNAVAHYEAGFSKLDLVFDAPAIAATNAIVLAPDDGPLTMTAVPAETRKALTAAMAVYRKHWWPAHADANRRRIAGFDQHIGRHGRAILNRLTELYGESWPAGGVRVQISAYANWSGAYSTRGPLLVVASLPAAHDGTSGLEILFHEAMHQWDDQMDVRLRRAATRAGGKVPDGLSHAMIFYTAGHVTRGVVGGTHTPYADANGIWQRSFGRFRAALDAHWKPYLDGAGTMEDALANLLRALGK